MTYRTLGPFLVLVAVVGLAGPARASEVLVLAHDRPELAEAARALPLAGQLRVQGLVFDGAEPFELELERFRVFAEDAVIVAGESLVPVPDNAYFRGRIAGWPESVAVLSFQEDGQITGLVSLAGELWRITGEAARPGLLVRRLDVLEEARDRPFTCFADQLTMGDAALTQMSTPAAPARSRQRAPGYSYSARVAVDTDWEFLQRFGGNTAQATDYVGDLFAFSSSIYEAEVDTSLYISYLRWWPGANGSSDPWTQSNCNGALSEFRGYWLANQGSVERTIAHLLSGKSMGCGIAYLGVLCNNSFGYGVSGSLSGQFDPLDPTSAAGFWDILVTSHEIGHNFDSHHTHCYGGVLGNPEPVDQCYSGEGGCYSGPTGLPGCSAGGRCGTIMSYCHLLTGGYGNIALTFGANHPYGNEPWRVPTVMNNHVVSRAGGNPGCLEPIVPDLVFEDGFESGDTSRWSSTGSLLP